jgi:hypothetical protein
MAMVEKPRPVRSVICAMTESIGPHRSSSWSNAWHCVSIRLACGSVLVPGSPPKRHVAKTRSPSSPPSIALRAKVIGFA